MPYKNSERRRLHALEYRKIPEVRERLRRWNKINNSKPRRKEYLKEFNRKWRENHREEYRKYHREYQRKLRFLNKALVPLMNHKRRIRLENAKLKGNFTREELNELVNKSKNCIKCNIFFGERKYTIDHIIPISRGGGNNIENIQLLCGSCNSRKGNRIANIVV